jgi:hypothetical protein
VSSFRPRSAVVLVAWTLLTWIGRVPLLWGATDDSAAGKLGSTVPVVVFVALAVVAGVELVTRRARGATLALAIWSVGYWAVRLPLILVHDHPAGFKVVHAVLALVAVGLSAWTLVDLRSPARRRARV